ncbi:MAG: Nif3-like dinuclear metal center hexameric protein [Halobacteriovoraceae bacterium]|nr:Nif3-like dinuclear metal center hexameric protein [Halobacteriovoraceae bacterium]
MTSITRFELDAFLNQVLRPWEFKDYCPNGLQIEGKENVQKVAFAVSATRESIEKAIDFGADAMVVHHGLFWSFHGVRTITGPFAKRILPLIKNEISLFGHHLPLDAHPTHGNAAILAHKLELTELTPFGDYKGSPTGVKGIYVKGYEVTELKDKLEKILNHQVLLSTFDDLAKVHTVGIITGGANSGWTQAHRESLDAFITGEMSEHDWHEAKESEIHMYAGGHNATEKFGIQAIMKEVEGRFKVECLFIDSNNPA